MPEYASREIVHAIRERNVEHASQQTNKRQENKRHRTRCGEKARKGERGGARQGQRRREKDAVDDVGVQKKRRRP